MIVSERSIFLKETEIRPNKNMLTILSVFAISSLVFWLMNELDFFHVGLWEMRIGMLIAFVLPATAVLISKLHPEILERPATKWWFFGIGATVTLCSNTLMNFHTTILLLFPICVAMIYRSEKIGVAGCIASGFCTLACPILGYLLHLWDIPFLKELILIGTNVSVDTESMSEALSWLSVGKIVLYLVLPRLIMVGACSVLMFRVIRLGIKHVNDQVLLVGLSRHDGLTGLYNQNFFQEIIAEKNTGNVGLIFFDINGLKQVNDKNGHEYGDTLIKRCADSIKAVCNESDTFGFRLSGDEFLLLLVDGTEDAVSRKIAEWQTSLDRINEENKTAYNGMECSLAYGYASGAFSELEKIRREADNRMYENKSLKKTNSK